MLSNTHSTTGLVNLPSRLVIWPAWQDSLSRQLSLFRVFAYDSTISSILAASWASALDWRTGRSWSKSNSDGSDSTLRPKRLLPKADRAGNKKSVTTNTRNPTVEMIITGTRRPTARTDPMLNVRSAARRTMGQAFFAIGSYSFRLFRYGNRSLTFG